MPSTTQTVSFQGEQRRLRAYLARPESEEGRLPGVVVIHEAFGLNNNIRDVARRFADAGYVALAVNLFSGRSRAVCMAQFIRSMVFDSLDHGALRDLRTALDGLARQPYVDEERLGAAGFCLGGGLAIAWACTDNRLGAIAPFYGMKPRPLDRGRAYDPAASEDSWRRTLAFFEEHLGRSS